MTVAAVLALCACGSLGSPGLNKPSGSGRTEEPARVLKGTVETLAGPGYCSSASASIAASKLVGAMTVDSSGPFFFDTGTMSAGSVARGAAAGSSPRATPIVHALPRGPDPVMGTRLQVPGATAPSRLAGNGSGGFFIAAGKRVLEVDSTDTLVRVIGGEGNNPASPPPDDGSPIPAARATFSSARTVDTDEAGNLYISDLMDRRNATVRIRFLNRGRQPVVFYPGTTSEVSIGPDEIGTLAGVPGMGNKGDGGRARLATIQGIPPSIAVAGGRLYLGLYWGTGPAKSGRVRVINLTGEAQSAHGISVAPGHIETIAQGDEREISAKQDADPRIFSYVPGMDADVAGNLYLADALGHRILKIDSSGKRSVFAGTGRAGFNGNDRPASSALLNLPYDVKIGSEGSVLISDRRNAQVRSVDGAGTMRAAPGSGVGVESRCLSPQLSGSAGSAERPQPGNPRSVAADSAGHVYFALPARGQVKKLNRDGSVTRFAGGEEPSAACTKDPCPLVGDGGPAESAGLIEPSSLASRTEGIYVLDSGSLRVHFVNWSRKKVTVHGVSVPPGRIKAIAGRGRRGSAGDGGRALEAELDPALFEKGSLAADASGNLFLGEGGNRRIRIVDAQGTISTFAGEGGPPALRTCCSDPVAMTVDPRGNLYVADLGRVGPEFDERPRVWLINRSPTPLSAFGQRIAPHRAAPVAGNGDVGLGDESVKALEASLLKLSGLAMADGRLYLAEIAGFTRKTVDLGPIGSIRSVDPGGVLNSVSGGGVFGFNGDGMKAELTSVYPGQLAADPCGNLLIPDEGNDRVRRLNLSDDCALTNAAP